MRTKSPFLRRKLYFLLNIDPTAAVAAGAVQEAEAAVTTPVVGFTMGRPTISAALPICVSRHTWSLKTTAEVAATAYTATTSTRSESSATRKPPLTAAPTKVMRLL